VVSRFLVFVCGWVGTALFWCAFLGWLRMPPAISGLGCFLSLAVLVGANWTSRRSWRRFVLTLGLSLVSLTIPLYFLPNQLVNRGSGQDAVDIARVAAATAVGALGLLITLAGIVLSLTAREP
jgi:hypothetical protein